MDNLSIGVAFIAGIISFLSPCVLPLIPGYISFLSGLSLEELKSGGQRRRIIKKAGLTAFFFVIGFSAVFISLGASASFIGKFLSLHLRIFTKIAGILIVILGLHLLGALKLRWLDVERKLKVKRHSGGFLGAFLMGLAFAFGWTPCIGPILAGILALAATQKTVVKGMLLLAVYSAGLGIPFIITGFSVGLFTQFFQRYKRLIRWGEIAAGLLLIAVGALIFTNNLTTLLRFVPDFFYKFAK
ncbi:MAG: cytochrome C biogenesis protein [Omnitrophica WOR_2 bacterium RIFCSPLOWO2_02_FULL_45_28]|nr:MAG: cytochrome C biogenesis protein [Omnitrophica WOR_2 bacterium RIFCSPLOWO2_02_FULL_45_28]